MSGSLLRDLISQHLKTCRLLWWFVLSFFFFFSLSLVIILGLGEAESMWNAILLQKSLKIRIQEVKTDFKDWNVACWHETPQSLFWESWVSRVSNCVLCLPSLFPNSAYQIVVEELHPHRTKRETGSMECYQVPVTYQNAMSGGAPYYFAAELPPGNLPEPAPFTVGDNRTYQGFWNPPLAPRKGYNIYFQAMSSVEKVSVLQDFAFSLPWGLATVKFYKYSVTFVRGRKKKKFRV